MAKLGLELRLLSSDMDTEVEKWEEPEHDIVRQSQSLASMAYNMYLFTRWANGTTQYKDMYMLRSANCSLMNSYIRVQHCKAS